MPSIEGGSVGLKIHEDWGAYPEIVDATLAAADDHDIAVCLHTDGLNESTELDGTIAAIAGRTIHAYHVEGTGGGHIPDLLGLVREPSVLCSSTTPSLPWGPSAGAESLDMIMIAHEQNPAVAEDVAAARERIRDTSIAAEGPLHELGAISIINSDSQGMGRIGETIRRTWQLADAMKRWRASELGVGRPDGPRRRSVAPTPGHASTRPTTTSGCCATSPSTPGNRPWCTASPTRWAPSPPATRRTWSCGSHPGSGCGPLMVIKGGVVAWSAMGEGNASIHGAQPTRYGPDWGGTGIAAARLSTTFVSQAALEAGIGATLDTRRRVLAVQGTRGLTRADMVANTAVPAIEVSPARRRRDVGRTRAAVRARDPGAACPGATCWRRRCGRPARRRRPPGPRPASSPPGSRRSPRSFGRTGCDPGPPGRLACRPPTTPRRRRG